jgi:hypothetical protein
MKCISNIFQREERSNLGIFVLGEKEKAGICCLRNLIVPIIFAESVVTPWPILHAAIPLNTGESFKIDFRQKEPHLLAACGTIF